MPDPIAAKLEELKAILAGEPLVAAHEKERLEQGKRTLYEIGIALLDERDRKDVPFTAAEALYWAEELEKPEVQAELLNRLHAAGAEPYPSSPIASSAVGPVSALEEGEQTTFWTDVAKGVITTVLAALVLYWVLPKRR